MRQALIPRTLRLGGQSRALDGSVAVGRATSLRWSVGAPMRELRGACRINRSGARASSGRSSALTLQASLANANLSGITALERVTVLAEALPYLQRFHNKTIVIKYGGAAMKDPSLKAGVVSDLVLLSLVGIRPVLVHGGGPEINTWLGKVGIEAKFKNGLRVTDEATMEVVEMVLVGNVNKSLVTLINSEGGTSVGLCGKDGQLIRARQTSNVDLGYVGEVTAIDPNIVKVLVDQDIIPVIASVAADPTGHALNINADTAAGEIAAALNAEKLVLMTDVPGILMDKEDTGTLVREADISSIRGLIQDGTLAGGMIPKVECCVRSLAQGVRATHIIDGRQPHSLLQEILTDEGVGTMITG